jgi:hypothetical protein
MVTTIKAGGRMMDEKKRVTLELIEKDRRRELEFESEEDRIGWETAYRKSKWYLPYFLLGVVFNLLLYKAGLDLARNILLGSLVGIGVPIATMFLLTELHYRLFIAKSMDS